MVAVLGKPTGDDGLLMDIQSRTARIQNLHRNLPVADADTPDLKKLEYVLTASKETGCDKTRCLRVSPVRLTVQAHSTSETTTLVSTTHSNIREHEGIFMRQGGPQGHGRLI